MARRDQLLVVLILIGLLAAVPVLIRRHRVESANANVELVIGWADLESLRTATGIPIPELLRRFRQAGATGVAISEDTVETLVASGRLEVRPVFGGEAALRLIPANAELFGRITDQLRHKAPASLLLEYASKPHSSTPSGAEVRPEDEPGRQLGWLGPQRDLERIGLGIDPTAAAQTAAAGLHPVARLLNYPGISGPAISYMIADARRLGCRLLVCEAIQVLGFQGFLPAAAREITRQGVLYGSVEFGKQLGDDRLSRALNGELVRVHSITEAEMSTVTPPGAIERFVRAARDRNIRVCYLRLFLDPRPELVEFNLGYIRAVASGLEDDGLRVGAAQPFQQMHPPAALLGLMMLGVVAAGMLLWRTVLPLSKGGQWWLLAGALVVTEAALLALHEAGRQLGALLAALIFPTLGVLAVIPPATGNRRPATGDRRPVARSLWALVAASAVSLAGAMLVAGLLADTIFMVKVNQFLGIKAAHLLPLLVLGVILALEMRGPAEGESWPGYRRRISAHARRLLAQPVLLWQVLLALVGAGLLVILVLRTGNEPGMAVSGPERHLRGLLEAVLTARPRTKEFLIGHPAFLLGMVLLLRGNRSWGLPLMVVAAVGQLSLVNTYAHIHTPLVVSLLRSLNGLWLGALIGLALVALILGRRGSARARDEE